jgi:hypothetical protein
MRFAEIVLLFSDSKAQISQPSPAIMFSITWRPHPNFWPLQITHTIRKGISFSIAASYLRHSSYLLSSLTVRALAVLSELFFLELVGLSECSLLEAERRSRSVLLWDEFGRRCEAEGSSSMGSSSSSMIRPSLSTFASRSRRVSRPRLWQYQKTKRRTVPKVSTISVNMIGQR